MIRDAQRGILDPESAGPDGTRAVVRVLEQQGVDVAIARTSEELRAAATDPAAPEPWKSLAALQRVMILGSDLPVSERLAEKLVAAVEQLKVGDGSQEGTTQGPLIDSDAVAKVQSHIDDALIKGAQIATGGQPHALGGTFFQPTVVTGVTQKMRFAKEETFGPVAPLFRFGTEAEAIALANDTPFGLAAYFYTESHKRAWRVGQALEFGMVGLNTGSVSTTVSPFGGVKQSGLGREGARVGIEEYLESKAFHMAGLW